MNDLTMLTVRLQPAVLFLVALEVCVGCGRSPHTYAIHTVTINNPGGSIETTAFQEVPDAEFCTVAANASDKGIAEGSPEATTSGRSATCVSELPAELKKVASGERLAGAYIVRMSWPPLSPLYSISRGFPVDNPDTVCQDLIKKMRDHLKANDVSLTCRHPLEVASVQEDERSSPTP